MRNIVLNNRLKLLVTAGLGVGYIITVMGKKYQLSETLSCCPQVLSGCGLLVTVHLDWKTIAAPHTK